MLSITRSRASGANECVGERLLLTPKQTVERSGMRNSADVLFFSRGRGYSHAIRDIQIAAALAKLRDDVDLRFVSYGSGAQALSEHHKPLIDLEMPDDNPLWLTVVRAGELMKQFQPDLVIAHEEFAVPPVAKISRFDHVYQF